MEAFAATGAPPPVRNGRLLRSLAAQHVVVLEERDGEMQIAMAHPFASHRQAARAAAGGRSWWGNCAWDAFGIVAALGLTDATVTDQEIALEVRGGAVTGDAVFHVLVPARRWWDDIGYT